MGYMPVEKLSLKMIIIMIFPLENASLNAIIYKRVLRQRRGTPFNPKGMRRK